MHCVLQRNFKGRDKCPMSSKAQNILICRHFANCAWESADKKGTSNENIKRQIKHF